ncbi:unnamed protein product [Rotaria magnacalcarata]|uniref:Phosphodiesterase n=2 Tax=Rotaria magnacalcarata TaxID=392030 RepID=A0A816MKH4_9BILA|nr:unnamed protein product [Rotaria magnacalcarata]
MPILNRDNVAIGVAQIINKKTGTHEFTAKDINVFRNYLTFCGLSLSNAQLFELSIQEYKKNQVRFSYSFIGNKIYDNGQLQATNILSNSETQRNTEDLSLLVRLKLLLNLARNLFREQNDLERLVHKITTESQGLMQCARCCVYILDWPVTSNKLEDIHFSKGFDMTYGEEFKVTTNDFLENSRYGKIAYHVAKTMETVNLNDLMNDQALAHLLISNGDDTFELRNILSVPIMDSDGHVIGVSQVMNKLNGRIFTEDDVAIIEAFSVFCGLGIHNTRQYENVVRLTAKQNVAFEVLSYHVIAPDEDVRRVSQISIPEANQIRLYSWEFNDMILTDDETVLASVRMFIELDLPKTFRIPNDIICRWVLSVKKNYRPVIYHNWRHAFNVAQTMFSMLTTGGMNVCMSDLERMGLLIACLSHDLDHRGTNNAFQAKVDAPLAKLYTTSTLEHHHFDQCIMILQTEGNNILQALSADDYKLVVRYIEAAIVSTDLALYFRKRGEFQKLVDANEEHWEDPTKKELLRGMMMTACDVAAICKPWELQQVVAKLVASEFFQQGDIERTQLHVEPIPMMDREKKDELPKMQVGFIDSICLPLYKMLSDVDPGLNPLFEGCKKNRDNWEKLQQEHDKLKSLWSDSASQEVLRKIVEASKPELQAKNLVSSQSESTVSLKVIKTTNENSVPAPVSNTDTKSINREQQTTTVTAPILDPTLITTIHANKGAIGTIRGQITELRHDVDQLRALVKNRKRSAIDNTNATHIITNEAQSQILPPISSRPPSSNGTSHHLESKSNTNNVNRASVSHHHHHHHHIGQSGAAGHSSVCTII